MKKVLSKIGNLPGMKQAGQLGGSVLGLGEGLVSAVGGALDNGVGLVTATVQGIPFFGSTTTSTDYDHTKVDEKHYFLVPDQTSEQGFSLYVMRSLPAGVPPINDLPKQRLLHLPSAASLPMMQDLTIKAARDDARSDTPSQSFIGDNLNALADEIDKVDDKAFNGVLLVGGLVALVNPLAGAAVAVNAVLPSVGLIVSKYGLKIAGDAVTNMDVSRQIKRAEKDVIKQFKSSNTAKVINPLLAQLARAHDGDLSLDDTLQDFETDDLNLTEADRRRFLSLTEEAIRNLGENTADEAEANTYLSTLSRFVARGLR